MEWIVYSFLMFSFSVSYYMALRKMQIEKVSNKLNTLLSFAPALPIFAIWVFIRGQNLALSWEYFVLIILATFFFSYLGNIFSFIGIQKAPNAGYSLIIQKSYAIYTAIAAVFLFNSELSLTGVLSIVMIIVFSALILIDKKSQNRREQLNWIIPTFLAFFCFGSLALFSKWLLMRGVDPIVRAFYVNLFVSIMYSINLYKNRKSVDFSVIRKKRMILLILVMGISNGLFNAFMQLGFNTAPNVGYVNIINTASISMITIFSVILYKDKLSIQKVIGIMGITLGLVVLLLG